MAQIGADGTPYNSGEIVVSDGPGDHIDPSVAFDGQQFLIVWSERTVPSVAGMGYSEGRLLARRFTESGDFFDAQPFVIADRSRMSSLAYANGVFLVAWVGIGDRRSTHGPAAEVFGVRITPSGFILDSVPLLISRDPWDHYDPHVTAGPEGFLVGWLTWRWYGHHSPVFTGSSVAIVSSGGTVTEPIVLQPLSKGYSTSPSTASNGSEYLAAWISESKSHVTRISATGAVRDRDSLGNPGRSILANEVSDVSFFQGSWLIVESRDAIWGGGIGDDVRGFYFDADLNTKLVFPIATSPDEELEAKVASDGIRCTVVYRRIASAKPFNGAGRIMARLFELETRLKGELPAATSRRRSVRK